VIKQLLIENVFDVISNLRITRMLGTLAALPALVVKLAHTVALAVGLANRHSSATWTRALPEAITLPDLPEGFSDV
jgi:kanamycin nucleotidyltransferase